MCPPPLLNVALNFNIDAPPTTLPSSPILPPTLGCPSWPAPQRPPPTRACLQSWSDPYAETAAASQLATLPPYVNIVCLAFMQPDTSYAGGITLDGTGLQFRCAQRGGWVWVCVWMQMQMRLGGRGCPGSVKTHQNTPRAASPACQSRPTSPLFSRAPPCCSSSAQVVRDAVVLLKRRRPFTRVLVSVGGASYTGWDAVRAC